MIAPTKISRDEWLKALDDAGYGTDEDPTAITMEEFRALLDVPLQTAQTRMKALVRKGKAIQTHKWGVSSYGRRIRYRAYKLVA